MWSTREGGLRGRTAIAIIWIELEPKTIRGHAESLGIKRQESLSRANDGGPDLTRTGMIGSGYRNKANRNDGLVRNIRMFT